MQYTIRLADTDAAGVVYFANILKLCHHAYEDALLQLGIDLKTLVSPIDIALPITHTSADFLRPLFCGDRVEIQLLPQQRNETEFEISYQIFSQDKIAARALTRHVCIDPTTRSRSPLPEQITRWLVQ